MHIMNGNYAKFQKKFDSTTISRELPKKVHIRILLISVSNSSKAFLGLRPHLDGLGYPRKQSPRVTLAEVTFISLENQPAVFIRSRTRLGERGSQGYHGKRDNFSSY